MQLRDSERRFATLFRVSPVGTCITRLTDGVFLDVNEAFARIVDQTREELLGRSSLDLNYWLDPEDRSQLVRALVDRGAVRDWEVSFRRKDGRLGHSLRSLERIMLDGEDCILTTLSDITERKRIEEELNASRSRLEVLSRQLIATQESERRYIARELHDQIGQSLTAIKLNLNAVQSSAHEIPTLTILHETIAVVDQTLEQVRTLSLELRPSILDDLGLVAALRWYLDRQASRAGFTVQFAAELSNGDVSKEIETTCFRVTQEIVTNVVRHAHARNVRVEIRRLETELELFVQDDGVGFDPTAARGNSMGLSGMRERVMIVGGRMDIQSAPSRGTEIRVRVPLLPTEPEDLED